MRITILDDYQDAARKLHCISLLDGHEVKVYNNTVKGLGQLAVRLRDTEALVLIRERTSISRALIEKLPQLKLIAQTGRAGSHVDVEACTARGIAVAQGVGSPVAPAELTGSLRMESKEKLLMELLGHTARSLTHLTASMTSMSFELMRSEDDVVKAASRQMIDRMATISAGLDEHWRLIGELTGVHVAHEQIETIQEIQLAAPPQLPAN